MAATPAGIERAYGVTNIRSHIPITLDLAQKHNYGAWRQLFLTHCQRFGLRGHLDGTLVSNGDFDVSWKNQDEIVKLWLYGTLSPSLYHSTFQTESTSQEIWLRIENEFRYILTSPENQQRYNQNRGYTRNDNHPIRGFNTFQSPPPYQLWSSPPYWPRPAPMLQPYPSSGFLCNGPQYSNLYDNWQNHVFVNMYEPPSPDYLAFNAMNLQQPMGTQRYIDMGARAPFTASPAPFRYGEGASTSHSTLAFRDEQNQIVQGQTEAFTHFLSIPLDNLVLKNNLEAFKNSILGNNGMGIEESIFASPNTFHLTVVMLKLGKDGSLVKAQKLLEIISPKVRQALKYRPVSIRLKGLKRMGTKPLDETGVLYAPVEEVDDEGRLLNACHVIIDAFESAGLTGKDPKIHLKLHATVMNAIYRKDKSKKTFNARGILEEFGNKNWGTYLIEKAHISRRYPYDPKVYFHCCGSLLFPT